MNSLAQTTPDFKQIETEGLGPGFNFSGASTIADIISAALPYIFFFAGILLLVYFIIGGYKFMFSAGDPKKVAEGKGTLTNALIGFIVVFTAFWLVQIFGKFLGLQGIGTVFG